MPMAIAKISPDALHIIVGRGTEEEVRGYCAKPSEKR